MYGHTGIEWSRPNVELVSGCTFDGVPFTVALDCARAIDNGATARIYKGEIQTSQPLIVAVKVFGHILSDVQQELLVREMRAARQVSLTHDLILAFLGTVDVGQQTAIVSLFMRNGNLIEYIKSHKNCDKNKLIRQVAEAVCFLHTDKNLVHGDIKCANVLISDFGDALLADFGLSTFIERNQSALATVTAIRNMNTLRFAAPELLNQSANSATNPRSKTRESDVYAFGMLILEAVTEKPPWHGLGDIAVVLRVAEGQHPPRPSGGTTVTISHAAWELCLHCWRTDPTNRLKMVDVLERFRTEGFAIGPVRVIETRCTIISLAYMPSGRRVVSGSSDGSVHIWDTLTGLAALGPMQGHTGPVWRVAASPNGLEILSLGLDKTIRRWDAIFGTPVGDPIGLEVDSYCITYLPGSDSFAFGDGDCVRFWHANAGGVSGNILRGDKASVTRIAFSPNGSLLASGSDDGMIRIWDMHTLATITTLDQHTDSELFSIAFSPDGAHLAAAALEEELRIWNVSSGLLEIEIEIKYSAGVTVTVTAVAFSPSGNRLMGFADGIVRTWDARTGQRIGVQSCALLSGHEYALFSLDRRSLVSRTHDGGIVIWELFPQSE